MMKTPPVAGLKAIAPDIGLSEFASGRKAEAPAPAAQQDKTAGRTELPHHSPKNHQSQILSTLIAGRTKLPFLMLLFLNTSSPKDDPTDERAMAPKFGP
jgi:hypothetical protein